MKHALWLILLFLILLPLQAQDNPTRYEIALQRIEEARVSGAEGLDLSGLSLTELPSEIMQLNNLKWLWLDNNHLKKLPSEIGELSNLQVLYVRGSQLTSIPPEIGQLSNLLRLYLSMNQLASIPPEIGRLVNLQELDIGTNQLNSLPEEIGQLSNLQTLDLGNNHINNLPAEIAELSNLCFLNLSNNNLGHLPTAISSLTQLTQPKNCDGWFHGLYIGGNPLISPPQEVIDKGTEAVLAYLRNEAWWHIKKMIIYIASGIGLLALLILGLRLRYWSMREKKKNG